MPATAVHHISPFQPDEDFINKSLLASLDAQADAEPTSNTDDADQIIQASYPSTSNSSSSGSPNVNFPMSHQVHLPRPESPPDAHKQQMQMLRSQESFYNHPPGLYTGSDTFHRQPEFSDEYDAFPNNYRNTFTSYPNTTRSRQQANINTPYRDPAQYFPSPGTEMYGTSASQPLLHSPFDSRPPYDYPNGHTGGPHKPYPGDQFNVASSLLHSQGKQPQQLSLSNYSSSVPSSNSVQLSSQTPFGPHVPANLSLGSTSIVANGPAAPIISGHGGGVNNSGGEEISTIFVVGFPEDMQEREFVNMFTFSEGFEAATLKIPNKEFPQYPTVVGAPPSATLTNGLRGLGFPPYGSQSDPYNLSGVDGGRDGVLGAAWHSSDERAASQQHFLAAGGLGGINGLNVAGMIGTNSASVPPRKQIIGFAKFKTRQDALIARDQLQGKRVDIEKGAVLKAEMAKKNLHTKRGVGSVPIPPIIPGAGLLQNPGPSQQSPLPNGLDSFTSELKARDAARLGGWRDSITLQNTSHQSNDLVNGSTSLGNFCNGPVSREEEEDRRRESLVTTLGGISLSGSSSTPTFRGPREEERSKESQREKELNLLKLRATNTVAFDAFHSVGVNANAPLSGSVSGAATPSSVFSSGVGASIMSRQTSAGQSTNTGPNTSLLTPSSSSTDGSPMILGAEFSQQKKLEEVVGPWDNLSLGVPVGLQAISRPRSETQGSSSPILSQVNDAPTTTQNGMNALGHIGSLLNGSIGLGSNTNVESEQPRLINSVGGLMTPSSGGSDGNTSPTLPSPASGVSHGSNSSSSSSSGTSAGTTGATRGSVDQNPPINTLYVGNLPTSPPPVGYPADYLEETLKEIFSQQRGYRQLSFRQKAAGPMCFVEFDDVRYAALAKQELSGNTLGGLVKNGIRLSYSKNPLGVRGSTHVANGSQHLQPQSFSHSFSNPHSASFQHYGADGLQARLTDEYIGGGGGQHHQQHHLRRGEPMMSPQGPPFHHQSFGVGSGSTNSNPNTFLSSPPPRFYSTSPGGVSFASALSTPLTSASSAFVPRSMAANTSGGAAGNQHHNGGFASSPPNLSPFGVAFASSESAFHHPVPAAIPPEQQQSLSDDS